MGCSSLLKVIDYLNGWPLGRKIGPLDIGPTDRRWTDGSSLQSARDRWGLKYRSTNNDFVANCAIGFILSDLEKPKISDKGGHRRCWRTIQTSKVRR